MIIVVNWSAISVFEASRALPTSLPDAFGWAVPEVSVGMKASPSARCRKLSPLKAYNVTVAISSVLPLANEPCSWPLEPIDRLCRVP